MPSHTNRGRCCVGNRPHCGDRAHKSKDRQFKWVKIQPKEIYIQLIKRRIKYQHSMDGMNRKNISIESKIITKTTKQEFCKY